MPTAAAVFLAGCAAPPPVDTGAYVTRAQFEAVVSRVADVEACNAGLAAACDRVKARAGGLTKAWVD